MSETTAEKKVRTQDPIHAAASAVKKARDRVETVNARIVRLERDLAVAQAEFPKAEIALVDAKKVLADLIGS